LAICSRNNGTRNVRVRRHDGGMDGEPRQLSEELDEARRRLAEREQQFRSLFEYHPDAVFAFDRTGRVILANQACAELCGYSVEEILSEPRAYAPPDEFERGAAFFQAALAGQPQQFKSVIVHKLGHRVDVLTTQIPIVVGDEITGVFGIAKDITEQRRSLEALETSEQRFRTLAENLPDIVYRCNRDLRVCYINSAVERLTGVASGSIVGRTPREAWVPGPHASALELALRQVLRTGGQQIVKFELQTLLGRRAFEARMAPEFDADGAVESVVVAARDVTDHERAEQDRFVMYQQLLAQQSELRGLIERLIGNHKHELEKTAALYQLKKRERDILSLVARGLTNKEIAATLNVSVGTVKNELTGILSKLDVSDRTQAATQAVRLGLAED
jgi:PAS domain S-box-containing protein